MTDDATSGPTLTGSARRIAIAMGTAVAVDAALGIAAIIAVPYHRHTAAVPTHGGAVYLGHALLGVALGVIGPLLVPRWKRLGRAAHVSAITGCVGLGLAGAGGILTVFAPTRLVGMGCMLLGWVAAETGYLVPAFDATPPEPNPFLDQRG